MRKDRVLLVDDDPQNQRRLRAHLLVLDYEVQISDCGEDGIVAAAEFEPLVILMTVSLPGIDGTEACRRLREWSEVPIILMDGPDLEEAIVEALDAGADDYVAKPIRMAELLARIRAVLRRTRDRTERFETMRPRTFRNLSIDVVNHKVSVDGRHLHLTPTEFELLGVLASFPGRVLTHRELLTRVWGLESAADTQYLHVFVGQLRRKIEPTRESPRHIVTEPGVGYMLAAA